VTDQSQSSTVGAATLLMARWVSAVADRVKNPLASISGALDVLDRQLNEHQSGAELLATTRPVIHQLHQRVAQLNWYLDELSTFALPPKIDLQSFRASQLIDAIRSRWHAVEKYLSAPLVHVDDPSVKMFGDLEKLAIALECLITNSFEAIVPGVEARVSVTFEFLSGNVFIHVDDNGSGIAAQYRELVGNPFFSTKVAGSGLGLSIARRYINAHGGELQILPQDPVGTRITIKIPQPVQN